MSDGGCKMSDSVYHQLFCYFENNRKKQCFQFFLLHTCRIRCKTVHPKNLEQWKKMCPGMLDKTTISGHG